MSDKLQPLQKRPLIKGALKPPLVRVNPPSYTEKLRPNSEVTIMKQDWQSDPASETTFDLSAFSIIWSSRVIHLEFLTPSDTDTADKVYKTTTCSTSVPQPFVNPPSNLGT